MKRVLLLLIMIIGQASSTVEDTGGAEGTGVIWPPSTPSLPASLPCPVNPGHLLVIVDPIGPKNEADKGYTTQGKPLDFTVTVSNKGPADVQAELCVLSEECAPQWFSWTTTTLDIPAGATRSESLQVIPDINAVAGKYNFKVDATAKCTYPGADAEFFTVQNYDYASETAVSGSGQFQMSKDVSSMNSGIKSDKDLYFSGSVDALVKNEYLVEQAKGRTPNFQEQDAVDNYNRLIPSDTLSGTETFKSSKVFGGVGAKVIESFDLEKMEFQNQDFNLHQTGSLKKMAEFKTADNFTGYFAIDARQSVPGQRSLNEQEAYSGAFEIARRLVFRDKQTFNGHCFDGSCVNKPAFSTPCFGGSCFTNIQPYSPPCLGVQCMSYPTIVSPCLSGSCSDFAKNLNNFAKSA